MNSEKAPSAGLSFVFRKPAEQNLIEKIEPVVLEMGFKLRDVEVEGSRELTVRVILESKNETPIGIEDCVSVHRILSPLFDVWDPFEKSYTLEVCSPGDKPSLRTLEHFEEVVGEKIRFQTFEPLPMPEPLKPRRNWEGNLKGLDLVKGQVLLSDDYGDHSIPVKLIRDAVWIQQIDLGSKEKKKF